MGERMAINQGDIYWVQRESAVPHPYVVIQEDVLNHSRISTVVACALTSNIKRINLPGNVLLEAGEANLPRQSVVEVAKVVTVDKTQLRAHIGTLSRRRIDQILAGMRFIQTSFLSTTDISDG
jgi:mRNA interferase MazF